LYKTNPEAFYNPAPTPTAPLPGQPGSDVLIGGKPAIPPAPLPGQPGSDVRIGGKPAIPSLGANPIDVTEFQGSLAKLPAGAAPPTDPSYFDQAKDFINKNISPSGIQEQAAPQARQAAADAVAAAEKTLPASITGDARAAMLKTTYDSALKAAMPGIFSTYAPVTALGLGAVGLAGGFKAADAQPSAMRDELMKPVTQRIAEGGT
jgi:hypothetical protein